MSAVKEAKDKKGVRISRATGGAYADVREVIESELTKIRSVRAAKTAACIIKHASGHSTNGNGKPPAKG